jgi:hypothetical protein
VPYNWDLHKVIKKKKKKQNRPQTSGILSAVLDSDQNSGMGLWFGARKIEMRPKLLSCHEE